MHDHIAPNTGPGCKGDLRGAFNGDIGSSDKHTVYMYSLCTFVLIRQVQLTGLCVWCGACVCLHACVLYWVSGRAWRWCVCMPLLVYEVVCAFLLDVVGVTQQPDDLVSCKGQRHENK